MHILVSWLTYRVRCRTLFASLGKTLAMTLVAITKDQVVMGNLNHERVMLVFTCCYVLGQRKTVAGGVGDMSHVEVESKSAAEKQAYIQYAPGSFVSSPKSTGIGMQLYTYLADENTTQ